jgi:hypothetical protein
VEANHGYAVTAAAQVQFVLPSTPAFEPGDLLAFTGLSANGFVIDLWQDQIAHGPGVFSLPESFGSFDPPPALAASVRTTAVNWDATRTFAGGYTTDSSSAPTVWFQFDGAPWDSDMGGGTYAPPGAIAVSDDGTTACFVESTNEHWIGPVTDARVWCHVQDPVTSEVRFTPSTVPGSGTAFTWADIAMTPSGRTLFVVGGDETNTQVWRGAWTTDSYGENAFAFTRLVPPTPGRYVAAAVNQDGQTVVIASAALDSGYGLLLLSGSGGASFEQRGPIIDFSDVALSRDGQTIVASSRDPSRGAVISRDGGWVWTTALAGSSGTTFSRVACSADCAVMAAARSGSAPALLVSTDLGRTWLSPGYSFSSEPAWLSLSGDGTASGDVWAPAPSSAGTLHAGRAYSGASSRIIGAAGASVTLLRLGDGTWTVQQATGVLQGNYPPR